MTDEELAARFAAQQKNYEERFRAMEAKHTAQEDVPTAPDWADNIKGRYKPQLGGAPQGELPGVSKTESALRGAGQGATLGFLDELAGAIRASGRGIAENVGVQNPLTGEVTQTEASGQSFPEAYRTERDAYRAGDKLAEQNNPATFGGTEMLGGLINAPLAGPINSLKTAAVAGTKLGALFGLGSSEADLTQGDVGGAAADTAKGAAIGLALSPVGYGLTKGGEKIAQKAGDVLFNLRSMFGGEPKINPGRALDALGVRPGSAPNLEMASRLDQKYLPAEKLPPSAFADAAPGAPEALARVGKHPRIQVAESKGIQASKNALRLADETDASSKVVNTLVNIRRGKLPSESLGPVGDAIALVLRRTPRRVAGIDENAARALSDPTIKAELAQIIATGREPLAPDALAALVSRGLTLLGVDNDTQDMQ